MNRYLARTLSFSVFAVVLPIAACQETQNLEGAGQAASVEGGHDAGAAADSATSAGNADASVTVAKDSGTTSGGAGKVVMFGGQDANGFLGDTWTWDGTSWTQNTTTGGPDARAYSAAASLGGSVVMFGGEDTAVGDLAETWSWNGAAWTKLSVTGPAAAHDLIASTLGTNLVLFGVNGDDDFPQTWSFSGSAWTQLDIDESGPTESLGFVGTTYDSQMLLVASGGFYSWNGTTWTENKIGSGGPAEEGNAGIAAVGGKVVLFGGDGENFNSLDETWTWDGTNWTLQNVTTKPSPRSNPGMATMKDGTVVLFGGCTHGFEGTADATVCADDSTWTWDGTSWTEHAVPGPSARAPAIMVAE